MFPLVIFLALGAAIYANRDFIDGLGEIAGNYNQVGTDNMVGQQNPWHLSDVDSSQQAGSYSRAYDESFEKASARTGVPFALLKAHAIRESSLNPKAYHYDDPKNGASYGLMQIEWNSTGKNANRLAQFGGQYSADSIRDGSILYSADDSAYLGACIIKQNLDRFDGNLRDAINAYNTGVAESKRQAPANYVDNVLKYYHELLGENV